MYFPRFTYNTVIKKRFKVENDSLSARDRAKRRNKFD